MYQQWIAGQSNYAQRWLTFVELAARQSGVAVNDMTEALTKCSWFKRGD